MLVVMMFIHFQFINNCETFQIKIGSRLKIMEGKFVVDKDAEQDMIFTEHIRPVCLPCISTCGVGDQKSSMQHGVLTKTFTHAECKKDGKSNNLPSKLVYYPAHKENQCTH